MTPWTLWLVVAQQPNPIAEDDGTPERYVTDVDVHAVIVAHQTELAACVPVGSGSLEAHVDLQVEPDGTFGEVRMRAPGTGNQALDACVVETFRGWSVRPHDDAPVGVAYTIVVKDGVLVPYPVVELTEREQFPRFFYLPPTIDDATRRGIEAALGLGSEDPGPGVDSRSGRPWTSTED